MGLHESGGSISYVATASGYPLSFHELNASYIKIDIAVNHSLSELWKVLQNALNSVQPLHHLPYDTALH